MFGRPVPLAQNPKETLVPAAIDLLYAAGVTVMFEPDEV
jgi:hypothetical protein